MEQIEVLQIDTQPAVSSIKQLRAELKSVKDEMTGLESGSDAFLEAANKAGELQHQLQEINESVRGASADFGDVVGNISKMGAGIVGSFQTVNAVMSLFNVQSEEVIQSIKTMQSLMAITQGLNSIDAAIKSINKLRNSITSTTVAAKALKAVMTPKAILAIVAAITALSVAVQKYKEKQEEANRLANEFNKIQEDAYASVSKDVARINMLVSAAEDETLSLEQRKLAIDELNRVIPDYNANIDETTGKYVASKEALDDYIKSLIERAAAEKAVEIAGEKLLELQKKQAEYDKLEAEHNAKMAEYKYMQETGFGSYSPTLFEPTRKMKKLQKEINQLNSEITSTTNKYRETLLSTIKVQDDSVASTGRVVNAKKQERDIIADNIKIEYALLALKKEQDVVYAQSRQSLEDYLAIQEKELAHYKDLKQEGQLPYINLQIQIEATKNAIKKFDEEQKKALEDAKNLEQANILAGLIDAIDNGIAANALNFEQGYITQQQYIENIIELEYQRLALMQQGTTEWYNQSIAIEQYKKDLEQLNKEGVKEFSKEEKVRGWTSVALSGIDAVVEHLNGLKDLEDGNTRESFEKQKKLSIAAATFQMIQGITSALSGAFTTKSGPWDIPLGIAQAAGIAVSGAMQIKKIQDSKFDSTSAASTSISSGALSSMIAPVQYTQDVNSANIETAIKDTRVYVTESDITRVQNKVKVSENENLY